MTNKEWIKKVVSHQDIGKVPFNFMFSPPVEDLLREHYRCSDLEQTLDFPLRMNAPTSIKPLYASPDRYGDTIQDEYGVTWSTSYIDRGVPIGHACVSPVCQVTVFPTHQRITGSRD